MFVILLFLVFCIALVIASSNILSNRFAIGIDNYINSFKNNHSGFCAPKSDLVSTLSKSVSTGSERVNLKTSTVPLDPWYVTGFSDAEASFHIQMIERTSFSSGWKVSPHFSLHLHKNDLALIYKIQSFFGNGAAIGSIYQGTDHVTFKVISISQLIENIIPHFDKYPLITQKRLDYELFKKVVYLINNKEHLTKKGLEEIFNLKAQMNIPSLSRNPDNSLALDSLNLSWLVGLIEGEGCFFVKLRKASKYSVGYQVELNFFLVQNNRDLILWESIKNQLNCGKISMKSNGVVHFVVYKFSDICSHIIPLLSKHPLLGEKAKDFNNFCKVAELMKNKAHLTESGLQNIIQIKEGMNRGRYSL